MSIAVLKLKFESLGIIAPKSQNLARYIVEPKTGGEVVFNEQATCTQKQVIDVLYDLIGPYKVYSDSVQGVDFISDSVMKSKCIEKFGKHR